MVFSRDETADDKIKRIAETSKNPRNIVVVSDDRGIIFFIKSVGALSMCVQDFLCPGKKERTREEPVKTQLNYSQVNKINEELKKIWLK